MSIRSQPSARTNADHTSERGEFACGV